MALLKYVIYITYVPCRDFNKILLLINQGRFYRSFEPATSKPVGCYKHFQ